MCCVPTCGRGRIPHHYHMHVWSVAHGEKNTIGEAWRPYYWCVDGHHLFHHPTIFFSIENSASNDPEALTTLTYTWFEERKIPWLLYSHKNSGFHPWKRTAAERMQGILTSMAKGDPTLKTLIPSICMLKGK